MGRSTACGDMLPRATALRNSGPTDRELRRLVRDHVAPKVENRRFRAPSNQRNPVEVLAMAVVGYGDKREALRLVRRASIRAWICGWRARIRTWNPLIQSWS